MPNPCEGCERGNYTLTVSLGFCDSEEEAQAVADDVLEGDITRSQMVFDITRDDDCPRDPEQCQRDIEAAAADQRDDFREGR